MDMPRNEGVGVHGLAFTPLVDIRLHINERAYPCILDVALEADMSWWLVELFPAASCLPADASSAAIVRIKTNTGVAEGLYASNTLY